MQLDVSETHLILSGSVRFKDLVLKIPGMNWHAPSSAWRAPRAWGIALACRGVLGDYLELTPEAVEWAELEKQRCRTSSSIRMAASVDDLQDVIAPEVIQEVVSWRG
jgi:hypothetical protein